MPAQPDVTWPQVQASNARIDGDSYPRTAVFVGGTAGIGEAVIEGLAAVGKGRWPARIYVVGRQGSAERVNRSLDRLRAESPGVEFVWTPGEVSLLAEVERICAELREKEKSLDLLWLSPGYAPMGGREDTSEGLIVTHCLDHYSRALFIQLLLPLLKASPGRQGRVVSVLAAGMETTRIDVDNLNFERPGSFRLFKARLLTVTMHTMAMEQLAEANKDVTFVHAYPGLVNTGNLNRGWRGRWLFQIVMNVVLAPFFLLWPAALSIDESRERMLYLVTSAKYGGHGVPLQDGVPPGLTTRGEDAGGLFLAGHCCGTVENEKVLTELRKEAKGRIWAKTEEVLRSYLSVSNS